MYQIEVVKLDMEENTDKGNVLENFSAEFLKTQNYKVHQQVRLTASELDLLCDHEINNKKIYVECKAHKTPLSADILTKLLGTITLKKYSEGWLITTGPFGKDAKGFVDEWRTKPVEEREKLSFYGPEQLIKSFIRTSLIIDPKAVKNEIIDRIRNAIGNWTLMLSSIGTFWVVECLEGGIPIGLLFFDAKTGDIISDTVVLNNLSKTDTSLKNLDFLYHEKLSNNITRKDNVVDNSVIPVQQGDSWDDYRPARPEDFVGRIDSQKKLLDFFYSACNNKTSTRIFAITGNSGMGKSSFIAKMRDRVRNARYKSKYYLYAVDVRAAKHHTYILNSLINCFVEAMEAGFITKKDVSITDYVNPFNSDNICHILNELKKKGKGIILVFDQFEELYSRPELFSIFEKVKDLSFNATSIQENFIIGFAWKTDSTVYQDHPAYHLWHSLHDQRLEILLSPFSKRDSENVLSIFEKQLSERLPKDLRRQLISHAQGYPWLLKKLCIHIFEQLKEKASISDLIMKNLDIDYLFNRDLQELSQQENACLHLVAQKAPVDISEITEISNVNVVPNLINKRLLIRSGDRLIVYWDIFREYLLTKKVPILPFNYIPFSPSVATFLRSILELKKDKPINYRDLATTIKVGERTAMNIVSDLFMLKIADGKSDALILKSGVDTTDIISVLSYLRKIFGNHIVVQELKAINKDALITQEKLINILKTHNPTAQYNQTTWRLYANKIGNWLSNMGYLSANDNNWINKEVDLKDITVENYRGLKNYTGSGSGFTLFNTSPDNVIAMINEIQKCEKRSAELKSKGLKNAIPISIRLGIASSNNKIVSLLQKENNVSDIIKYLIDKYTQEPSFIEAEIFFKDKTTFVPIDFADYLIKKFNLEWSKATKIRVGRSLTSWYKWIIKNKMDKSGDHINAQA
jgi:hypothetical protein